jgi:hypothetical protein
VRTADDGAVGAPPAAAGGDVCPPVLGDGVPLDSSALDGGRTVADGEGGVLGPGARAASQSSWVGRVKL